MKNLLCLTILFVLLAGSASAQQPVVMVPVVVYRPYQVQPVLAPLPFRPWLYRPRYVLVPQSQ